MIMKSIKPPLTAAAAFGIVATTANTTTTVILMQKNTIMYNGFYRAMHYSAKRGIAIACRPSVCDVGEWGPHRLEILETNVTDN